MSPRHTLSDSPQSAIDEDESEEEDYSHLELSEHFKRLQLADVTSSRFFGPSSHFKLVSDTLAAKSTMTGQAEQFVPRGQYWNINPVYTSLLVNAVC
jgi:hypothetical protein